MLLVNFAHESLILQYTNGGEAGGGFPLGGENSCDSKHYELDNVEPNGHFVLSLSFFLDMLKIKVVHIYSQTYFNSKLGNSKIPFNFM